MNPEQERKLNEIYDWMQARKRQQIAYPLDSASRNIVGGIASKGLGDSALTQTYNVSGGSGGSITGPKAYSDTIFLVIEGIQYEIPFITTSA